LLGFVVLGKKGFRREGFIYRKGDFTPDFSKGLLRTEGV
jgi:hypothetical protein